MGDGEVYYQLTEIVSEDIILTAVYEPVELREQLSITSFSLKDQPSDVSFTVTGNFGSADEVESNITVMPKDGSEPVMVDAKDNEDGTFTVYAPDGFNAGASYELTLGDGLCFKDDDGIMDAMFRTVYFIIKKDLEQEVGEMLKDRMEELRNERLTYKTTTLCLSEEQMIINTEPDCVSVGNLLVRSSDGSKVQGRWGTPH